MSTKLEKAEKGRRKMVRRMVPGATDVCRVYSQWPTKGPLKSVKPKKKHLTDELLLRDPNAKPKFWPPQQSGHGRHY